MLRSREEWLNHAVEKGTDGSMVYDVLRDWKEDQAAEGKRYSALYDLVCAASDALEAVYDTVKAAKRAT